jgi:ATP-binding cassette subfamily F protein uup
MPRLSAPVADEDAMSVRFDVAERGGDLVAQAANVRLSVDGRVLIEDFTSTVRRGEVLGLLGPNGAG